MVTGIACSRTVEKDKFNAAMTGELIVASMNTKSNECTEIYSNAFSNESDNRDLKRTITDLTKYGSSAVVRNCSRNDIAFVQSNKQLKPYPAKSLLGRNCDSVIYFYKPHAQTIEDEKKAEVQKEYFETNYLMP
jgi:hypothetical protein